MSTLSMSPAFRPTQRSARTTPSPPAPSSTGRPVARLTRRGRVVLVLAFLALALSVMTAFGALATATHESGTPEQVRVLQVGPGDTLYDIAGRVARPGHVREMVHHIAELNSLSGTSLQVGQRIAVPRS
ncbi:MAG: LysM peptidoglycan-binding domain-containing protein [Marmoricola sp.]